MTAALAHASDTPAQRRADVLPVLIGYVELRVATPTRVAVLAQDITRGGADSISPMGCAYADAIALALDLTVELMTRGYAPVPQPDADAEIFYAERAIGVSRHTHALADMLDAVLWHITTLRRYVDHEQGLETEQRKLTPPAVCR